MCDPQRVALLGKEPAAREEAAAFQKLAREVEGFIRKQLSEIAAALADLDREGRLREGSARPGALMLRRLSDHLSHGSACCIAFMIYRSGGGAHIASGCGSFDNSPYLLVLEGFDQYIVAALLQDIEPQLGVAQA